MGSLFDDWGSVSTSYKSESLSGSTDATFAVEGLLCRESVFVYLALWGVGSLSGSSMRSIKTRRH